jgi:hypothetical protein
MTGPGAAGAKASCFTTRACRFASSARLGTKPRFGFGHRTARRFLTGRIVKSEGQ